MEEIKETLKKYVEDRYPVGDFLRAVLENDLFAAMSRADSRNRIRIHDICNYIYNKLPMECWGDKETVKKWLKNE
jgi:hypothetical protein